MKDGNHANTGGDWKSLWNWKGLQCIQTFIWLNAHDRILTNYRRSRWGVGISPTCPCCGSEDETTLHVLRDCNYATQVWIRLVPSDCITDFFSFDCRNWVFTNHNKRRNKDLNSKWKTTFMTTC